MSIKETIIFAPNANETELLRSLSKLGYKTFGLRIMNAKSLSLLALERNGQVVNKKSISSLDAGIMLYRTLKEEYYFRNIKLSDSIQFVKSINELEMNMIDESNIEEFKNGYFKDKNEAVLKVYKKYKDMLFYKNFIDSPTLIREVINRNLHLDVDIYTLKEFPLNTLEKELLRSIKGHKENNIDLISNKDFKIEAYNSFFGEKAEVEYVFDYIYRNHIPLDQVTVAVSNNKYKLLFDDVAKTNNIPISFGIPSNISDTNPGKLLIEILNWIDNYYHKSALNKLLNSIYIDKEKLSKDIGIETKNLKYICDFAGALRVHFDKEYNNKVIEKYEQMLKDGKSIQKSEKNEKNNLEATKKLCNILNNGVNGLLQYTKLRKSIDNADKVALDTVMSIIEEGKHYRVPFTELIIEMITGGIKGKVSCEGKMYVTTIKNAKSVIRPYLFVVGMESGLYPGASKEDYIVLDTDYNLVGYERIYSHDKLEMKKEDFFNLLKLNSNSHIFISYPYYSCEDLKTKNASSLIFDVYNNLNGGSKTLDDFQDIVNKYDYFSSSISSSFELNKAYSRNDYIYNEEVNARNENDEDIKITSLENKSFTASNIDSFFRCPYKFYLEQAIGLDDPFKESVTEPVSASSYGNILHAALERLDKKKDTLEDFLNSIIDIFNNNHLITNPVLSVDLAADKLEDLLRVGETAYHMASTNKTLMNEENISHTHKETGIKIFGFPDRAEIKDDKVIVIDYKTKNKIEHNENDFSTCGQILTYAYIINKELNKDIVECTYRYLKQNKNITISKENINNAFEYYENRLRELKKSIDTGKFAKAIDIAIDGKKPSVCEYCAYKDICQKDSKEEGDDEDE